MILGIVCDFKLRSEGNTQRSAENVTEREAMQTIHLMGLICRTYKGLRKLNKTSNATNKWVNELNSKSQKVQGNKNVKCL